MATSQRWVYYFGRGKADGKGDQRDLLGGKGAGLAEMTRIGLPVPAGFTISTFACQAYNDLGGKWPAGLDAQVRQMVAKLERDCRKKLGSAKDPLLVSVRSGAARSMPGMMETILNLGLNDRSVIGLAEVSGNRRFAYDAYRRLIMMYGSTARGVERHLFDHAFDELKRTRTAMRLGRGNGYKVTDTDVSAEELEQLCNQFKAIYRQHTGEEFPQDPYTQLVGAINAVFGSWNAEKAVTYRRVEKITGLIGTAVNVCQMVFGNMGDDSGTGVCFTRDPSTGEPVFYGDMLVNAQGEDVVAGVRTPVPLSQLQSQAPDLYDQLEAVRIMLEVHYKEMQDLEFTFERGKLYMLQCRTGKRSPQAAFKIAVDQATKGLGTPARVRELVKKRYLPKRYAAAATKPIIGRDDAIRRVTAADVERLFYPVLDPQMPRGELDSRRLGQGIGAVPGAAVGEIVFNAKDAESKAASGATVILVRKETSPEDVGGMHASAGILTATGGKTSHAAVVARGWGKCCIVGCEALNIDYQGKTMSLGGRMLREGDTIALDGSAGIVYEGRIRLVAPTPPAEYETLMDWCDERRRLAVRTNADTPADARKAVELGAEGIGLCRTEHMFFDASQPKRLVAMREMILADNEADRRAALEKLLPFQRDDFEGIFEAMAGKPVTIRLLDPPLHEFLPHADNRDGLAALADELNGNVRNELSRLSVWDEGRRRDLESKRITPQTIIRRVEQLHEANPMLGHRGCRLCVTYPEILEMQVRAIIEAAVNVAQGGVTVLPEIMIPLSIDDVELAMLTERTRAVADAIIKQRGSKLKYLVGTMIETPRAALLAERMGRVAEFFSFGTNDLTQMTLGLSRDDAGRFLPDYLRDGREPIAAANAGSRSEGATSTTNGLAFTPTVKGPIFSDDPFQSIDRDGVGLLMRMSVENGRAARANIKLGVCGEHGGDPKSIAFCHEVGLDYVSCSPFRVPVARLSAAQAAMNDAGPRRGKGGPGKGGRTTKKSRPSAARTSGKKRASNKAGRSKGAGSNKSPAKSSRKAGKSKASRTVKARAASKGGARGQSTSTRKSARSRKKPKVIRYGELRQPALV